MTQLVQCITLPTILNCRRLSELSLTRSKKLLLLPTFYSPIYSNASIGSGRCKDHYSFFYTTFTTLAQDLQKEYPDRVFTANTTSLLTPFASWLFLQDHIHLTQYGNQVLGTGVASLITQIESLVSNGDDGDDRRSTSLLKSDAYIDQMHDQTYLFWFLFLNMMLFI